MEVDEEDQDYLEVMNDLAFLQSVLQNLPGVDPDSEAVRAAMGATNEEEQAKEAALKKVVFYRQKIAAWTAWSIQAKADAKKAHEKINDAKAVEKAA